MKIENVPSPVTKTVKKNACGGIAAAASVTQDLAILMGSCRNACVD
jgi:hypothetical protein